MKPVERDEGVFAAARYKGDETSKSEPILRAPVWVVKAAKLSCQYSVPSRPDQIGRYAGAVNHVLSNTSFAWLVYRFDIQSAAHGSQESQSVHCCGRDP